MSSVGPHSQSDDTLVDLLIKQVTEGLTPVEKKALEAFDLSTVNAKRRELEHLVAALSFGIMANLEAPPPALRASIEQRGLAHVVTAAGMGAENVAAPKPAAPNLSSAVVPPLHRRGGTAGWLAAAACLVLAIIAWMRPVHPVVAPPVAEVHVTVPPAVIKGPVVLPPAPRTAAQERDALLARSETLKVTLNATKDPARDLW